MTTVTVTVDEARDRLPELLRRAAAGETVVLTDGGRWVGRLAPPPPSPEERAAAAAAGFAGRLAFVRQVIADYEQHGVAEEVIAPLRAALAEARAA